MNLKDKIKFKYYDTWFYVPKTVIINKDWRGNPVPTKIDIGPTVAALMLKQYVKKNFPKAVVNAVSSKFSGGNSVTLNVSDADGRPLPKEDYEKIYELGRSLVAGRFDGMTDSYEYNRANVKTALGSEIILSTKYISTYNKPRYTSLEWAKNEILTGKNLDYVKGYVSESAFSKIEKWAELLR